MLFHFGNMLGRPMGILGEGVFLPPRHLSLLLSISWQVLMPYKLGIWIPTADCKGAAAFHSTLNPMDFIICMLVLCCRTSSVSCSNVVPGYLARNLAVLCNVDTSSIVMQVSRPEVASPNYSRERVDGRY